MLTLVLYVLCLVALTVVCKNTCSMNDSFATTANTGIKILLFVEILCETYIHVSQMCVPRNEVE